MWQPICLNQGEKSIDFFSNRAICSFDWKYRFSLCNSYLLELHQMRRAQVQQSHADRMPCRNAVTVTVKVSGTIISAVSLIYRGLSCGESRKSGRFRQQWETDFHGCLGLLICSVSGSFFFFFFGVLILFFSP